ncbi:hypothetical protein CVV65_14485 [Kyrpidia spormannii]|uniref:Uncharacterized protein n=2 Tax=Kyrpidia spormannii TaxID=2055160 RepID=A0A2K8N9K9_9BACL|nr:hypothetical protein [Kyrpidia spormannii]ATY85983.1 hypothetical protein CVV65_14485 [Kyrpidia spormannii]CAB3394984.1 conserved protein of unknown function [Kyrpidia spormannii]CAB3395927.1 conserved protein of unknown function [Kyrpidia spormannii]
MDEGITALACRAKADPDIFVELVQRFHPLITSIAAIHKAGRCKSRVQEIAVLVPKKRRRKLAKEVSH